MNWNCEPSLTQKLWVQGADVDTMEISFMLLLHKMRGKGPLNIRKKIKNNFCFSWILTYSVFPPQRNMVFVLWTYLMQYFRPQQLQLLNNLDLSKTVVNLTPLLRQVTWSYPGCHTLKLSYKTPPSLAHKSLVTFPKMWTTWKSHFSKGQFCRSLQCITLTCPTVTGLLFLQSLGQIADLKLQIQSEGDLQEWAQNWTSSLLGSWITVMEAQTAVKRKVKTFGHAQDESVNWSIILFWEVQNNLL